MTLKSKFRDSKKLRSAFQRTEINLFKSQAPPNQTESRNQKFNLYDNKYQSHKID